LDSPSPGLAALHHPLPCRERVFGSQPITRLVLDNRVDAGIAPPADQAGRGFAVMKSYHPYHRRY
jgi:hypothetical protein